MTARSKRTPAAAAVAAPAAAQAAPIGHVALPAELKGRPGLIGYRVTGNCMAPLACDGDAVIADPDADLAQGELVLIEIRGRGFYVKQLVSAPPRWLIRSYTGGSAIPLVTLESFEPSRCYAVKISDIIDINRVVHVVRKADVKLAMA